MYAIQNSPSVRNSEQIWTKLGKWIYFGNIMHGLLANFVCYLVSKWRPLRHFKFELKLYLWTDLDETQYVYYSLLRRPWSVLFKITCNWKISNCSMEMIYKPISIKLSITALFTNFLTPGLAWELDNLLDDWLESISPTNHPKGYIIGGVKPGV